MSEWTRDLVEDRVLEAADVLKRLPEPQVQGYFNTWPQMLVEFADLIGREPVPLRRPPPSPAAISRMEASLDWSQFLHADDARLLWARADRTSWKEICWRFGISRATAHRRWDYALCLIALRLNGRPAPKRSRRHVVERARVRSR